MAPGAVLAVMCVGYFLVLLDVTIVNVALPRIGGGLDASVSGLQWVVDGYALALASLMLVGGTVGDRHGHKRVVLIGLAVFGVASAGCGLAPSIGVLTGARAAQGVGAALLLPGTLAIISNAFPERRAQARAIGIWAGIGSLALPAGPLLGGGLIAGFGWRAVFWVNVPIVIAAFVATLATVRESRERHARPVDVYGVLLGIVLLCTVTFAFISAGHGGVASPAVITAAALAVAAAAAFVWAEAARGEHAMLPLGLFRRRGFPIANGAAGMMNLGTLGVLFLLTLYLQAIQHRSPIQAGLALVPLFAPLAILAPLAGRVTSRIGPRLPVAAGLLVAAAGLALLDLASRNAAYVTLLPAFLLWGIGLGVLTPAVVAAAIEPVPAERAGLASAINNTARQAGGAIGIAIAGAIAGEPTRVDRFLHGFRVSATAGAILYLGVAAVALTRIPGPLKPAPGA